MSRLLIVSNRLPITVQKRNGTLSLQRSSGGLATALSGPHETRGGLWIGWPGRDLGGENGSIQHQLDDLRVVPVPLSREEVRVYYEHISNAVLWPICHDRLDQLPLRTEGWDVYERVNARFADAVAAQYQTGDLIWVHDYQLLRLPALIRDRIPNARIGFFLHIPFPNPEIFFTLPTRRWLVEGMLGADLIGFHTRRYRGHFTAALRRLFNLEMDADGFVGYRGRRIKLGHFPLGVDADAFAERASAPEVQEEAATLKADVGCLLVGVDRLDYTKGIRRRLLAVERLLEMHREWHGRLRLIQVAVPSREAVGAYRTLRRDVEGLAGRINGNFGTPTWTPIHYLYRSIPDALLLALYRAADVMLVTPLRDGMNLVAKEFAAARTDGDGVLMLSEFAGAADELTDALIVNPYDVDATAEAMHGALTMTEEERRRRMGRLRAQVTTYTVHRWSDDYLKALAETGE